MMTLWCQAKEYAHEVDIDFVRTPLEMVFLHGRDMIALENERLKYIIYFKEKPSRTPVPHIRTRDLHLLLNAYQMLNTYLCI